MKHNSSDSYKTINKNLLAVTNNKCNDKTDNKTMGKVKSKTKYNKRQRTLKRKRKTKLVVKKNNAINNQSVANNTSSIVKANTNVKTSVKNVQNKILSSKVSNDSTNVDKSKKTKLSELEESKEKSSNLNNHQAIDEPPRKKKKQKKDNKKLLSSKDENAKNTVESCKAKSDTQLQSPDSSSLKKRRKKKKKKTIEDSKNDDSSLKPVIKFPKVPEDYSANWKKFQSQMPKDTKKSTNIETTGFKKEKNKKMKVTKKAKLDPSVDKSPEKEKEETEPTSAPEIWFDNVDPILLEPTEEDDSDTKDKNLVKPWTDSRGSTKELVKNRAYHGVTNLIAMDCEMVGVGFEGKDSNLARVSLVNHFGHVLYDTYVKPIEKVTDYRTAVSGIRPSDLKDAVEFSEVQKKVHDLVNGRILIGHALQNDFKVLFLSHPKKMVRDTSKFKPFRKLFGGGTPSLKKLSEKLLGIKIQSGEHSSIQDAQAAMRIYTLYRKEWEELLGPTKKSKKKKKVVQDSFKETLIKAIQDSDDDADS